MKKGETEGKIELPPLPYAYDALEPVLDEETLHLHHDKHHAGYVKGLIRAEAKLKEARAKDDFSLIKHWEKEVAYHGSGHILHSLYWDGLSPTGKSKPSGKLAKAIQTSFGSYEVFVKQMVASTNAVEGSGWGILAYQPKFNKLVILQCEKHQNLTQWGSIPIFVIDVWEHAYYLQYQNRRLDYIKKLFTILNWSWMEEQFNHIIAIV
jgi:Fe-Mn family superoxide dismutase